MRVKGAYNTTPKYLVINTITQDSYKVSSYKDIVSLFPVFNNVDKVRNYFRRGWKSEKGKNKYNFIHISKL